MGHSLQLSVLISAGRYLNPFQGLNGPPPPPIYLFVCLFIYIFIYTPFRD